MSALPGRDNELRPAAAVDPPSLLRVQNLSLGRRPVGPIFGRERETRRIEELLSEAAPYAPVTVTGPAGVGKSRLVFEVADRMTALRPIVLDLSAAPSDDAAAANLERVIARRSDPSVVDGPWSGADTTLLVVDGVGAHTDPAVLDALAAMVGTRRLLISALNPVGFAGERVVPVAALPVDSTAASAPDGQPIVGLFLSVAAEFDPTYEADDEDVRAIEGVARCVGGLPLAIVVAASLANVLPPPRLLRLIAGGKALEVLGDAVVGGPWAGRPTLRESVARTYDGLDDDARDSLHRLVALKPGFDDAAATAVLGHPADGIGLALSALSRLRELGLVERHGDSVEGPRFSLDPLLAEFVHGHPTSAGSRESAAQPESLPDPALSTRELEVLAGVVRGLTNRAIGRELGLSTKTVMHYTSAIYRKLGVRSRSEAAARAVRSPLDGA